MEIEKNIELLRSHILLKYGDDKRNTADNYCRCLWRFLNHFKEYPQPKAINDDLIVEYLLTIPGRSNRCTHHSAIKKFYWLKRQPHKFQYIPYPEKEEKLPVHVNKSEFVQMMNVCQNNKHRAIIALMFDAGLRVSEVINLKLLDLDESNMIINVVQGKGRKDRKIKLTKTLLGIFNNYRSEYNPIIYLFNGQSGREKYSVESCQAVVRQLAKKAGIEKHFTPHKFRHGFAMGLLENGTDMARIQEQMGHHSEKTTKIYARMNNKVIQDIESPLEQIMRESGEAMKQKVLAPIPKEKNIMISLASSDNVYSIELNGKKYSLKERGGKIVEASQGATWAEGVSLEKAILWFEGKGGKVSIGT